MLLHKLLAPVVLYCDLCFATKVKKLCGSRVILATNVVNKVIPRTTNNVTRNESRSSPKGHYRLLHSVEGLVNLFPKHVCSSAWLAARLKHASNRTHDGLGSIVQLHLLEDSSLHILKTTIAQGRAVSPPHRCVEITCIVNKFLKCSRKVSLLNYGRRASKHRPTGRGYSCIARSRTKKLKPVLKLTDKTLNVVANKVGRHLRKLISAHQPKRKTWMIC